MAEQKLEVYNLLQSYSWSLNTARASDAIKNNIKQGWKVVSTSFVQNMSGGDTDKAELWVIYEKDDITGKSSPQITYPYGGEYDLCAV